MKTLTGLFQSFDSQQTRREIENELSQHLDLLTGELCRQNLPRDEARALAEARFGNVEHIRDQCLEISMRNTPQVRALKFLLILLFLAGMLLRVLGMEYHVARMGDILMMVGLLGRLFLYVRALNPSRFFSKPDASSQLILSEHNQVVAAFDPSGRTPLERLISEK